ncbi:hypothetical protein Acr_14g0006040 [Actinidia rufa]|uniref:Uncharacterized protein n=1 Tax=Actinidia rufa TaxID=165716 RepID=A0A7J0FQG6_9ERIC|nr:hypothetical protein Acr_14g0006040 [Actinidia rufa]
MELHMGSDVEESENSGKSEFLIEEDQLQVGGSDGMSDYQSGSEVGDYSGNEQDVQAINADRFMKGRNMYHFRAALKEFAIARGFQLKYGVEAPRMQLYRGKKKALEIIEGNRARSYTLLPKYAGEIRKTNPGSFVKLELEKIPQNMKLPTSKSDLMGEFYSLVLDGNNGLFPLVVGVVENESKESGGLPARHYWALMVHCWRLSLRQDIGGVVGTFLIISRKKNIKKKFPGLKLRKSFWAACRAYIGTEFNLAMAQIQETSPEAHDWMRELPLELWARHVFDCRVKSDHVTDNLVESFNHWIRNARGKPVLVLMENIRTNGWRCCIAGLIRLAHGLVWHVYLAAYGDDIRPIHEQSLWDDDPWNEVLPPTP